MDAIIRTPALSAVPRQLRRPEAVAAVAAPSPAPAAGTPAQPATALLPPMPGAAAPMPVAAAPLPSAAAPLPSAAPTPAPAPVLDPEEIARARAGLEEQLDARRRAVEHELADARAAAEQVQAEACAAAEERGYAAGRAKGEQDAMAALQEQVERVGAIAAALADARAAVLEGAEDALVELAFSAVCRMLGEQAATREGVRAMLRSSAAAAHAGNALVVRLHPHDLALLNEDGAEGQASHVTLCADGAVELGGCLVDGLTGTLDARLETQLARLRATLQAVRAARRQSAEGL